MDDADALKLELVKKSYEEVLDATKHQDDKIGRFLTALAFLTTGAIALSGQTANRLVVIDGVGFPLPRVLLGGFLMLTLITVLLLVTGLGPNLKLPRTVAGERGRDSHLYFFAIADQPFRAWQGKWSDSTSQLREQIIDEYISETHNIATKTDFKFARTNEARALFSLALVLLVLAIASTFLGEMHKPGTLRSELIPSFFRGNDEVSISFWSGELRTVGTLILAAFAFVFAYDWMRLEQEIDNYFPQLASAATRERLRRLRLLPAFLALFVVTLNAPSGLMTPLLVAIQVISALTVLWILWPRLRTVETRVRYAIAVPLMATILAFVGVGVIASVLNRDSIRLAGSLLLLVSLESPRVFAAATSWRRRVIKGRTIIGDMQNETDDE